MVTAQELWVSTYYTVLATLMKQGHKYGYANKLATLSANAFIDVNNTKH